MEQLNIKWSIVQNYKININTYLSKFEVSLFIFKQINAFPLLVFLESNQEWDLP